MDSGIINDIFAVFQANIYLAIAAALLLIFLAWKQTKFFFTIFFIALILIGILYLITSISDTGVSHKKRMIQERELPAD